MKAKLLLFLVSVLFILPMNSMPNKRRQHKVHSKFLNVNPRNTTRGCLDFNLTVDEMDSYLIITFQSFLEKADITVTDKNGSIVAHESQSDIYKGKTINIFDPNNYPYQIEITSPTLDIKGEITQEDY